MPKRPANQPAASPASPFEPSPVVDGSQGLAGAAADWFAGLFGF